MVSLNPHKPDEFDSGSDTVVARYAYDALGRRIEFRNHYDGSGIYGSGPTEVATRFVYDGQNVIEEYNTNGDRQRYYVHGTSYIDERAVMHDDDEPGGGSDAADYYYLLKNLYTVVGLAQANGHELERYIYDAYGKATVVSVLAADVNFDGSVDSLDLGVIRSPSQWLQSGCDAGTVYDINMDGTIDSLDQGVIRNPANWMQSSTELSASALGNPYFFTARRRDAYLDAPIGTNGVKQIQYNRARYYNYDRWLQRDPAGYVDGMNLYEYVKSQPTIGQDPMGKMAFMGAPPPVGATTRPSAPTGKEACCEYTRKSIWRGRANVTNTRRYQVTESCTKAANPRQCCKCPYTRTTRGSGYIRLHRKSLTVDRATWGKCCSCRVQVRRQRAPRWSGWPLHVAVLAVCPSGGWHADHRPASVEGFSLESSRLADWRIRYPDVVESYCVSCDTAARMKARAKQLDGSSYGLIKDCYWYVRKVMGLREDLVLSDGCGALP